MCHCTHMDTVIVQGAWYFHVSVAKFVMVYDLALRAD